MIGPVVSHLKIEDEDKDKDKEKEGSIVREGEGEEVGVTIVRGEGGEEEVEGNVSSSGLEEKGNKRASLIERKTAGLESHSGRKRGSSMGSASEAGHIISDIVSGAGGIGGIEGEKEELMMFNLKRGAAVYFCLRKFGVGGLARDSFAHSTSILG